MGSRGAPRQYAQSVAPDSATNACRQNPELCASLLGKEAAAASAGATVASAQYIVDAAMLARIEQALTECADEARSDVLLKHLEGRSPSQEECAEVLFTEPGGQQVTRAMWLGEKMHQVAIPCAEEKLSTFVSGHYSVEPRYRINPSTRRPEWISPEEVQALLRQGGRGLKGTISPDVVIHMGNPVFVQHIFDFKFPCANTDKLTAWRPHSSGKSQGVVYMEVLGVRARRVQPRLGVEP
jgi:hypothetical protein